MNLPNKLTLTRIILVPVFMIFVSLTSLDSIVDGNFNATFYLLAGIVFAAASFTDYLDGHLARKWHMVTDFGKFADPLADKLLTTVAFIYMLRDGVCSPVVLCIILAREFAVSGLRMVAAGAKDGKVIAANMWGKVKTVLQMLSIIFYFFGTALGMGEAHIVDADGQRRRAACMGGLLSVLDGDVRLVATTWEWAEDIDQARAEASKKRAEEILARKNLNDREYELAQARLKRALVRTSVR